jgi:hypothetical protein
MNDVLRNVVALLLLSCALPGCSNSPDVALLASDAHFLIAGSTSSSLSPQCVSPSIFSP